MNFGHPKVLWVALLVLPLLALFLWVTWRKRQALIRSFVQNRTLAQLTLGSSNLGQKIRRVLLLVAVGFLLFTMARPQWGFTWEEASQRGRDIIVAIDTSRSMLAEDLQPNRLTRAKLAALDLLKLGRYDRFALVAFSGSAFLQCPLTFDDEAFRQSVQILEPGIIPQGGTAISEAIDAARRAFSEDADQNHRVLVLFTDGEDHEAGVMDIATRAAEEGMKIFTVGVGTPAGELLRVRDERGNLNYVKDTAGNVVQSRLNEPLLQEIATKTGGFYLPLQGANAMEVLYQKGLAPLPTSERSSKLLKRFKEQFYWPLSIAILLLVIEVFIPEQKRTPRSKAEPARRNVVAAGLAIFLFLPAAHASPSEAQRLYRSGEYDRALSEYQQAITKSPNDPRLHYNAGAAAFHAQKFDRAVKEFQAAAASPEIQLQQQAFYNLGNSAFRLGESIPTPQERMAIWEQAIQHYDAALKLRPDDKDAEFNRDLVRKKLEELKQQQQPQKQQKNDKEDNKDENEQDQENQQNEDQSQQNSEQKDDNKSPQKKEQEEQQQDQQQSQENQNNQQQDQQDQQQQEQSQKQNQDQEQTDEQANQSPQQQNGDKESDRQPPDAEGQAEAAQLGRMTPAQAKQLLDAQKDEEKALIFMPTDRKSNSRNRSFKDW